MRDLTFKILGNTAFIRETVGDFTFSLTDMVLRIDEKHMTLTEKAEAWILANR